MKRQLTLTLLAATMLAGHAFAAQSVPLVSGGVGKSEREAIEQQQNDYNLKLVYTGEGGMYLSNVNVTIRDQKGQEIVNGMTQGPIVLTNLEPGKYTVESSAEGLSKKQTVAVGKQLKTYQIYFPIKDSDNPGNVNTLPVI